VYIVVVLVVLWGYCCTYCNMCVLLYFLYYVCIAGVTLHAELLARSQYSESPATGHPDTGFSWFPCVYKQMMRWLLCFQVATTCFSCSPPDLKLNASVTSFISLLHVKWPLPPGDSPIAVNKYYYCYYYYIQHVIELIPCCCLCKIFEKLLLAIFPTEFPEKF
jgi:hypothetical protein